MCDFVTTVLAAERLMDRFQRNFAHAFFGAISRSNLLMGEIALTVSNACRFKYLKKLRLTIFENQFHQSKAGKKYTILIFL